MPNINKERKKEVNVCAECGHKEYLHNCYDEENQEFTDKYGCGVKDCNCESFKEIK